MQAYYNDSKIIFNIQIPILSERRYHMYHIIPLPVNNTKLIRTQPFINHNEKYIQHFNTACPQIEGTYYCSNPILEEDAEESQCIGKLMKNAEAHCSLENVGQIKSISQPQPNFILFININKLTIYSTSSSKNFLIEGTSLVHYKECNVQVNGITYRNDPDIYWDSVHIPPPTSSLIHSNITTEVLSLEKLQDYNFNIEAKLYELRTTTRTLSYATPFIILCIVVISLATVIRRRTSPNSELHLPPAPVQVTSLPPLGSLTTSLWPSLYTKGGGVTSAT